MLNLRRRAILFLVMFLALPLLSSSIPISCVEYKAAFQWPSPIYPDSDITLTVVVTNQGSKSLRVSSIQVVFDWSGATYSVGGCPQVIPSGSEAKIALSVHVPDGIPTKTDHAVTWTFSVADPGLLGGWGNDQKSQSKINIYVSKSSPPQATAPNLPISLPSSQPDYSGFFFFVLALMVVILVIIGLTSKKKQSQPPAQYVSLPYVPLMATQTQAFCRHCGATILPDSIFCGSCGKKQ